MLDSSSFGFFTVIGPFIFEGLNITTTAGLVGICVAMGVMSFAYEGLGILRRILFQGRQKADHYSASHGETTRLQRACTDRPPPFREWIGHISLQCLLFLMQTTVNYFLMLSVMTYNAWLIIAVVFGAVLGYFLLEPLSEADYNNRPESNASSQCGVASYSSTESASSGTRMFRSAEETRFAEAARTN